MAIYKLQKVTVLVVYKYKENKATDGNASDVGDLTVARKQQAGANY